MNGRQLLVNQRDVDWLTAPDIWSGIRLSARHELASYWFRAGAQQMHT